MKRTILFAFLSLVFVVGCTVDNLDEFETSDQVLGGDQLDSVTTSPYWDWADKWPGMVSGNLERADSTVTIKGGYEKFSYNEAAYPLQSTGMYAGSAQTVQIILPSDAPSNVYCQIGMGHKLLPDQFRIRYEDVVTKFKLKPGVNRVMSYFGGFVYIYFNHDEAAIPAGDMQVEIKNAIQTKDFIAGVTDERDWLNQVYTTDSITNAEALPFIELRSDRVIMTMTREEVMYNDASPSALLKAVEALVTNQHEYAGMSFENQMPSRILSDPQFPDSMQTPTVQQPNTWMYAYDYPMVVIHDNDGPDVATYKGDAYKYTNIETIKCNPDKTVNTYWNWGQPAFLLFEQFNENWWMPDVYGREALMRDPMRNLATVYYTLKEYGYMPAIAGLNFTTTSQNMINNQVIEHDRAFDLAFGKFLVYPYRYMHNAAVQTSYERAAPYMQLILASDWGLYSYVNKRSRETGYENDRENEFDGYDFFAMCATEYFGKDLRPFFKFWRYPVTPVAGDYMAQFDPLVKDVVNEAGDSVYFFEVAIDEARIPEASFTQVKPAVVKDNFPQGFKPQMYEYDVPSIIEDVHLFKTFYNTAASAELGFRANSGDTVRLSNFAERTGCWNWFDHNVSTNYAPCGNVKAQAGPCKPVDNIDWAADTANVVFYFKDEVEINSLAFCQGKANNFRIATRLHHIEYLTLPDNGAGGVDSVWVSTFPNEQIMDNGIQTISKNFLYHYVFSETYKTKGFRFRVQGNPTGQKSMRTMEFTELYPCYYGHPNKIAEMQLSGIEGRIVKPNNRPEVVL